MAEIPKMKGGLIIAMQRHLLWLTTLTLIIIPMACKVYFEKKENYTDLHHRVNQLEIKCHE